MIKVNSTCRFENTLNFDQIIASKSKSNEPSPNYHLHSILIHSGTLNAGHYYCYIRPEESDVWFKFNDKEVTPVMKNVAFSTGQGGYNSQFNLQLPKQFNNDEIKYNWSDV